MTRSRDGFTDFVLDQLGELHDVKARAMFGGYGLYQRSVFFGIIHKGRLYFKTDERTRGLYREQGMKPFRPTAKQTLKNYYEVPVDAIEDCETLSELAFRAASRKPPAPRRRHSK